MGEKKMLTSPPPRLLSSTEYEFMEHNIRLSKKECQWLGFSKTKIVIIYPLSPCEKAENSEPETPLSFI